MTLTINTNISSIIAQRNFGAATKSLNQSIERMSTGYKINHARDNAAGLSISDMWQTQISSLDIASANAATGNDLLTTAEQTFGLITNHLQRIRDLTEQAANGTYGSASLRAIQSEVYARLQEINRISANAEFNGIKLMKYIDDPAKASEKPNQGIGMTEKGLDLQVGLYSEGDSVINLDISLFKSAAISSLFSGGTTKVFYRNDQGDVEVIEEYELETALSFAGGTITGDEDGLSKQDGLKAFAAACSNLHYDKDKGTYNLLSDEDDPSADPENRCYGAAAMIGFIDTAIDEIASRVTTIGAAQNRIESALSGISVQSQNLVSSLSTLRDTDIAEESSNYIQAQILQQASATLLATANQTPSIALNLI